MSDNLYLKSGKPLALFFHDPDDIDTGAAGDTEQQQLGWLVAGLISPGLLSAISHNGMAKGASAFKFQPPAPFHFGGYQRYHLPYLEPTLPRFTRKHH
jgi:hypothetical protein